MESILIAHIVTTLFMTAICWFVQLVHYPLFREINLADFPKYEKKNVVTAYITVPTMIIEYATGFYLFYIYQDSLHLVNSLLMIIIGLSTVLFQIPIHLQLMNKATSEQITKLIQTNWIRTVSWTIRCGIVIYFIKSLIVI